MSDKRYKTYLADRYRSVGRYAGILFCLIGVIIIIPAGLVLIFPGERDIVHGFLWPGLGLILFGTILRLTIQPKQKDILSTAEGAAIVVIAWSAAIVAGAIPFHCAGLNFTQAVFEATSGWTTTGLSVVDVASLSPLLLFFRSLMQLAGGAGLAILMLSSMSGPAGVGLSTAEGRADQLVPQVQQSARLVLKLYGIYILFGVSALKIAGMDWLNAVNHTFCAVSTGGFSTQVDSIAFWNSPSIEAVLIALMLLGTTNFLTIYTLVHGKFRAVFHNGELRIMALILPASIVILFFGATFNAYEKTSEQIRATIFQAVSAVSTTGYATTSPSHWNDFGLLTIVILMLIGGGTGSTAGGIKQHRIYLLAKGLKKQFTEVFFSPNVVSEETFWLGKQRRFFTENDLLKAGTYIALYLFTWLAGGCALSAFGHPFADSLFEFASALGTVGFSVGVTTAAAPAGQLWVVIVGMFLGRLEFFVIFWGIIKIKRDISIFLPGNCTLSSKKENI